MIGSRHGAIGHGTSSIGYARFSVFEKKKPQGGGVEGHRADTQFPFLQQVHLVGADLFWAELVW